MANDLSSHSWLIDTASATAIWKNNVRIKFIEVIGGAAGVVGAAMAVINDMNGKNIINALYQTANAGEIQTYNVENWFEGIIVPTLGTGVTLRLHVR